MSDYTRNMQWTKKELLEAAGKVARILNIPLVAKTKAELASFLARYEDEAKAKKPARSAWQPGDPILY